MHSAVIDIDTTGIHSLEELHKILTKREVQVRSTNCLEYVII